MKIEHYQITTSMGCVSSEPLNFLTEEQQKEFNSIGYSGKTLDGKKMSRVEYLNSLKPEKEQFEITQTRFDKGDFREQFLLTRTIIETEDKKYTSEDLKQFGLFLGSNLKRFKGKDIDYIFNEFTK